MYIYIYTHNYLYIHIFVSIYTSITYMATWVWNPTASESSIQEGPTTPFLRFWIPKSIALRKSNMEPEERSNFCMKIH